MATKENTMGRWENTKPMLSSLTELQLRIRAEKIYCELLIAPIKKEDRTKICICWLRIVGTDQLETLSSLVKRLETIHDSYYNIKLKSE